MRHELSSDLLCIKLFQFAANDFLIFFAFHLSNCEGKGLKMTEYLDKITLIENKLTMSHMESTEE